MAKRFIVYALLVAALSSIAITGILYAQGTGGDKHEADFDREIDPLIAWQMPLADASSKIHELWQEADLQGFTGVRLDNDNFAVILYWKGEIDPRMSELVTTFSVPVQVVQRSYSLTEFHQEAKRLVELSPAQTGVNVTEAGPLPDFSGLRVGVESADQLTIAPHVINSHIRLEFSVASAPVPLSHVSFDRWDDISPFWGGAAIDHEVSWGEYNYCTTGFAVTTASDEEGMLTAAHCQYDWDYYTPDGDRYVGTLTNPALCTYDAGTLKGESYGASIFVGSWDSSQGEAVSGWEYPAVGLNVFVSGSWSGEHTVRVESTGQYVDGACSPWATGPGFWTVDEQGDGSAGDGDSGGPVARDSSASSVKGLGIISWGDEGTEADCEGRTETGRKCYSRSFHINLGSILSALDLDLQ